MEFNCVIVLLVENLFYLENKVLGLGRLDKYDVFWLCKHLLSHVMKSSVVVVVVVTIVVTLEISWWRTSSSSL